MPDVDVAGELAACREVLVLVVRLVALVLVVADVVSLVVDAPVVVELDPLEAASVTTAETVVLAVDVACLPGFLNAAIALKPPTAAMPTIVVPTVSVRSRASDRFRSVAVSRAVLFMAGSLPARTFRLSDGQNPARNGRPSP